ncbi:MAG: hypothetical protein E4H40_07820 [Candidatus Brocadiia bacterium]|nr:MAG: hypothetical protein E4H40_07820 [Candidatus Brocadiia bacterium]
MFNLTKNYRILEFIKSVYAIIDRMCGYPSQKKKFYEQHGYHLNFLNPKTFNEKIVWKKINDRNPLLPITADKFCVREYIVNQLGEEGAKAILIPLFYVTDDPKSIPFDRLPERYIIKSNHGSGQNLIINGKTTYTNEEIIRICANWLRKSYGLTKHEWAYQKIKRKILIEELIMEEDGSIPKDFKFYVFQGKCEMVMVIFDRFIGPTRTLYTPEWEIIPLPSNSPA